MVFAAREGERVTPYLPEGSRRSRANGQEAEVNRSEKQSTFPPSRAASWQTATEQRVGHFAYWQNGALIRGMDA